MEINPFPRLLRLARIAFYTRKLRLLDQGVKDAYRSVEEAKAAAREVVGASARKQVVYFMRRKQLLNSIEKPNR